MSNRYVLKIVYPLELVQTVELSEEPLVLGRSREADLMIEDEWVSRRHCQVWVQNQRIWVEDLGSTNGTYVDGNSILFRTQLQLGQRIQLGKIILQAFVEESGRDDHTLVLEAVSPAWESASSQYLVSVSTNAFIDPNKAFSSITQEFLQHEITALIEEQCLSDESIRRVAENQYLIYTSSKSLDEAQLFCDSLRAVFENHRFQWQETPFPFQFKIFAHTFQSGESDAELLKRVFP